MFEKIYDFTDFLWGIPLTILAAWLQYTHVILHQK